MCVYSKGFPISKTIKDSGSQVSVRKESTNIERKKMKMNPIVLEWDCGYLCELLVCWFRFSKKLMPRQN